MLNKLSYQINDIQIPAKRAKSLDPEKMNEIAESILQEGQKTPIQVRKSSKGFVLVEGLHRLEALKALGEDQIDGYLVQARKH